MTPKTVFSGTAIAAISSVSQNAWMRGRRRDRVPDGAEAVLERPVEDEPDRDEQQQRRGSRARRRAGRCGRGGQRPSAASLRAERRRRGSRAARRARSAAARPRPPRRRAAASLSICPKMYTEATSVLNGMLPAISTTEPNSPTARANASAGAARRSPGTRFGQDDRGGTIVAAAGAERRRGLLHLAVELDQHRLHRAHDERQRHEQQREQDRPARVRDVDADRAVRAVEREQREAGDDRRQRERQVDERVDERACRGSSSRTSTQAISVPGDRVDRRDDERDDERQPQRRDRLRGA